MNTIATIFVVDKEPQVCQAASAIASSLHLQVRRYSSAEEFLRDRRPNDAGCVLIAFGLPGMNGRKLQQTLIELRDARPAIMLGNEMEVGTIVDAMRDGAVTVFEKPCDATNLTQAVRQALEIDRTRRRRRARRDDIESRISRLTTSERAVMKMMFDGVANKAVAARLGVSLRTVENRRAQVFQKTSCRTLAELVRCCMEAEQLGCIVFPNCEQDSPAAH